MGSSTALHLKMSIVSSDLFRPLEIAPKLSKIITTTQLGHKCNNFILFLSFSLLIRRVG